MKQKLRSVVLSRWIQIIASVAMGLLYGSYVFIFSRMVGAVNSVACILQPICDNEFPFVLVQRCDCNTLTIFLADSSNIVLVMAIAFLVIELGRRILGDSTRSESLLYLITHLPRSVDLRYRTNRILVLCVIAIICIAYLVGETMVVSVNFGVAFFIAWALAREIAPDLEYPAFIGATLALQSAAVRGMPDIFLLFLLLLILRTICGTVSKTVTALDVGVLIGVIFLLCLQIVDRTLAIGIPPVHQLVGVGVILIVFLISSLNIRACNSVTDCESEPVSIIRIQWTQLFTAIIVLFFVFNESFYLTGMFLHATIAGLLLGQYGEKMITILREPKK